MRLDKSLRTNCMSSSVTSVNIKAPLRVQGDPKAVADRLSHRKSRIHDVAQLEPGMTEALQMFDPTTTHYAAGNAASMHKEAVRTRGLTQRRHTTTKQYPLAGRRQRSYQTQENSPIERPARHLRSDSDTAPKPRATSKAANKSVRHNGDARGQNQRTE